MDAQPIKHRPLIVVTSDPPLLLVRAYQEGMAELMKLNGELSGSIQLEASFKDQIEKVNQELDALADKEPKYEQVKRTFRWLLRKTDR